jgi:hypothetical protein
MEWAPAGQPRWDDFYPDESGGVVVSRRGGMTQLGVQAGPRPTTGFFDRVCD